MLQKIQQLQALAALLLRQFSPSYRRQKALVKRTRLAIAKDRFESLHSSHFHLIRARKGIAPPADSNIKTLLEWRADNQRWIQNNPWRARRHEHSS